MVSSGQISAPSGRFDYITSDADFTINGKMNINAAAEILASGPITFVANPYIVSGVGYFSSGLFVGSTGNATPVSLSGHRQSYSTIDNFCTGVAECINTPLLAGTGISLSYVNGTGLYINSSGGIQISSSSSGFVVKTGINNYTTRYITNGNNINISYADGVSGNPAISLSGNLDLIQNITSTGNLKASSGIFSSGISVNGTGVVLTNRKINTSSGLGGGSDLTNDLTIVLTGLAYNLSNINSSGFIVTTGNNGVAIRSISASGINILIGSGNGLSGNPIIGLNPYTSGLNTLQSSYLYSNSGYFNNVLQLNGTGVSVTGHSHIISDISNFGSGVSGLFPSDLVYSTGYSNGQLLIGSGNNLIKNTLSAGTGISITNGSGTIIINTIGLQSTLTNPITGTGTNDYIARFSSSSGLTNSSIFDNGTNTAIGTNPSTYRFTVAGSGRYIAPSATGSLEVLNIDGGSAGFSLANDANTEYSIRFDGCSYNSSTGIVQRIGAKIGMLKSGSWNETAGGLGTKGNLVFYTNNGTINSPALTEKMRITSDGNIGIGTTVPGSKLTIGSGIGTGANVNSTTDYDLAVHHGDMIIISPEDISNNPIYTGITLFVSRPGGYQGGQSTLDFASRDRGNNFDRGVMARIVGGNATNAAANSSLGGELSLQTAPTGSSTPTSRLFINRDGNMGIGNSSPNGRLHVLGTGLVDGRLSVSPTTAVTSPLSVLHVSGSVTDNASLIISGPLATRTYLGVGNNDTIPFFSSLDGNISASTNGWGFFDRGTDGHLQIQRKSNNTSWNPVFTLDRNTGYFGIGTGLQATTGVGGAGIPERLVVDGTIRIADGAGRLQLYRGGGTAYDYTIGKEGNHLAISTASDGTIFRYTQFGYHASNGTWNPKTVINGFNGVVGINTTTPSGYLDIAGDVFVRGTGGTAGRINFKSGSFSDTILNVRSDTNGNIYMDGGGVTVKCGSQDGQLALNGYSTNVQIGHTYNAGTIAQHLRFTPGSSELMRMTNSGTIGIGLPLTNSLFNIQPFDNCRLHIMGSGANSASSALNVANSGNSSLLFVRNDGNIGIGTTTPSGQLHIISTGIGAMIGSYNTWTDGGKLRIYNDDNDSQPQSIKSFVSRTGVGLNIAVNGTSYTIGGNGSGTNIGLYGYADNGSGNYGLYVDAGYGYFKSRVGIGTTNPTSTLQVSGLITANSGNFTQSLQLNGTGISVIGHNHTISNITDFGSGVSGLFPSTLVYSTGYSNGQLLIGSGTSLVTNTLSAGTGIVVSNGSGSITINTNATSTDIASTIVSRSANGSFSAGSITCNNLLTSLSGILSYGNLGFKAPAGASPASYFPVFTTDPTSVASNMNSRTAVQIKGDIGLGNVENTALSTWTGSTSITTLGTITSGIITGSGLASSPSYSFIGNTKAGLYNPATNAISLATSGIDRLYVNSLGNVGIGTVTPSGKLHVSGTIIASGGNSTNWNTAYEWGNHAAAGYITNSIPDGITIFGGDGYNQNIVFENDGSTVADITWDDSNNRLQINALQLNINPENGLIVETDSAIQFNANGGGGNVGIGTATPTSKLDVVGKIKVNSPDNGEAIRIEGSDLDGGDVGFGVYNTTGPNANSFYFNTDNNYIGIGIGFESSYIQSSLPLYINNNVTVSTAGAAGTIGGASQTQIFQVNDASATDYVNLGHFNCESNVSRGSFMLSNNGTNEAWEDNCLQFFSHGANYPYGYYGGNLSDAGCAMMVTQGSEITKLQIGNYNAAPIEFFTDNTFRVRIDTSGNVGIGTSTPTETLDVVGNIKTNSNLKINNTSLSESQLINIINGGNLYLWSNFR